MDIVLEKLLQYHLIFRGTNVKLKPRFTGLRVHLPCVQVQVRVVAAADSGGGTGVARPKATITTAPAIVASTTPATTTWTAAMMSDSMLHGLAASQSMVRSVFSQLSHNRYMATACWTNGIGSQGSFHAGFRGSPHLRQKSSGIGPRIWHSYGLELFWRFGRRGVGFLAQG